jgi:indole-3-acetate monooxygenase
MTANASVEKSAGPSLAFDALLASARKLSPLISEQSAAGERQGRLTESCTDALRQAGLFSLFVPRALGGAELWPAQGIEIIEILSRADGSTGWVVMATQVAMATCGAYLPPAAAKTVFDDRIPLIAGQGAPVGKADRERNGYRLSGNWSYGSGLLHSEWIHTGAIVHYNEALDINPKTQSPEARICIVPITQAELKNNWDVLGLRSTGSVDYSIHDVFVPEEFTHLLTQIGLFPAATFTGWALSGSPRSVIPDLLWGFRGARLTKSRR